MAAPEEIGFSAERLERIRPMLQGYVDDEHLPGFLTVIARRGKIVHFETVGMRDIENKEPITPDTIFRIYSMSKPITSVAVMMLYEEGYFQLDTPVSRFIPEFKNMKVYNKDQTEISDAKSEMTIKHLLMHTAGLTYGWGNKPVDERYKALKMSGASATLVSMTKTLGDIPLVHEPGERWTYGVSTDVLGYLVEVVSGMPFEEFLQTRLFGPLGMVDTAFSVPPEKRGRFAALYSFSKADGLERVGSKADADGEFTFFPSGGGGLVSTAADYMRFSQMLLNGGELDGARILAKETVELMRYPHHEGWFGLGFAVVGDEKSEDPDDEDGKDDKDAKKDPGDKDDKDDDDDGESKDTPESVGSFSWGGAAATTFWIDPVEEVVGVLMTQIHNNPYPFHHEFKVLTYEALTK
ncbi:beta-lactamase family protein [Candidatus Poribacteria bacterium]|nr:beta-lactamase family protein [Candidatus Poribacteria bacterium]